MKLANVDRNSLFRALSAIFGITLNFFIALIANKLGLPLYLDSIGTVWVSFVGGLFPGIATAVATSVLCTVFNRMSVYYSIIGVLIAVSAAYFARKRWFKDIKKCLMLAGIIALISGGLGAAIQWVLIGEPQFTAVSDTVETLIHNINLPYFSTFFVLNIFLNLFDKGLSIAIALFGVRLMPEEQRLAIYYSGWRQRPISEEEFKNIKLHNGNVKHPIQLRESLILFIISISLVLVMGYISISIYIDMEKDRRTESAEYAAEFAADVADPEMIDSYFKNGREEEGYEKLENILCDIKDNANGVGRIYAIKVKTDGCYYIFDVNTEESIEYEAGEKAEFGDEFYDYYYAMLRGEELEPLETDNIKGWGITAYYPLKDAEGQTVCYFAAEVSMIYMTGYIRELVIRVSLIMFGFLFLVMAFGIWTSSVFLIYPINSITAATNDFMEKIKNGDDASELNESVAKLKRMDIRTGDEIENHYNALCLLAGNVTEQLWEISNYSEAVAKMQNGLIITMADMVENRDSDTGAHIQKTAEYVRIIVEGLRKKGYYSAKISPKYIADVVMSAPLHDVGKINIPDAILNKPGKLTDEEFEIMKTHTTAGRIILEKAIATVSGENYLKEARNMAAYHHEKWNGKGYPEGLHGEVIPLSARIMAVADVFDALTSKRVYKPAMPLEKALDIITEGAGEDFDPKCVEVFMDSLDEVKLVLKKYQNM
ncbi:MAG: HD domain-containing protein [Eubacterium sp.]|nr:HD domain-containing protein [Eubacterium sp.]